MEDIIKNKENTDKYIRSELWPEKTGKAARFREVSEWYWHTRVFPIFARILAVIFAICSIFVVLGETTLYVKQKDISFFPIFFKNEHGDVGTQILCMFPLTYIFATTYIGLFTLRIKGSYGLFNNNHTDPANLVWSAFFTARMVHPLIYNFLYFIKVENTQFNKVMGELNLVPYFGEVFIYFPLLIVFFALLNVLDFYTWFMVKLGIPQLGFSDNFDRQRLDEGKLLLGKCNF